MKELDAQKRWRIWLSKVGAQSYKIENVGVSLPDLLVYMDNKITLHEIKLLKGNQIITSRYQWTILRELKEVTSLVVYDEKTQSFSIYKLINLVGLPTTAHGPNGRLTLSLKDVTPDHVVKSSDIILLDMYAKYFTA